MAHRPGILSKYRYRVKKGKGGRKILAYLEALLLDPCTYCGQDGCDSFDHIIPASEGGAAVWENLTPCHQKCNFRKKSRGILNVILDERL